jgi:hypothetical protein
MAKNNSKSSVPTVPTMASILAARAALAERENQIAQEKANIKAQEEQVHQNTLNGIKEILDRALVEAKALYGETANMGLLAGWAKTHAAGNLVALSGRTVGTGDNADKGKRLSDEQKLALRGDLLKRALALKNGQSAEQMTAIMARYDVSSSTADNYKPTDAEIAAGALAVAPAAPQA